jgi:hypothetical protein
MVHNHIIIVDSTYTRSYMATATCVLSTNDHARIRVV